MFVDASAIVAVLLHEDGYESMADKIRSEGKLTSPIAVWEAVIAIARETTFEAALAEVEGFLGDSGVSVVPLEATIGRHAASAWARFGKSRHSAKLNLGDCFAYAAARAHDMPLLYVGGDFSQTDVNDGFTL